jgi:leucyl aminopeptidase
MALALCAAPLAQAAPAWITVGERAYALLQQQAPALHSQGSTQAALAGGASETVHLVQVDEEQLEALSQAVHESLRRCGGYRWHASRAAEGLQALRTAPALPAVAAPSYAIDNADLVQPLLAQVQDSRILATIQTLSDFQNRYYTSNPGVQASDQLAALWTSLAAGRSNVSVRQVSHRGWPQKSVVLTLQGSSQAKQKVVLGAHLDSIVSGKVTDSTRAPGADDDASGVASLTEVIRVLLGSGYQPRRTIEFMAYAAEEVGLRGSQAIAQQYKRQRQQVVGVLQLDMTAFQGSAGDLYLFTD